MVALFLYLYGYEGGQREVEDRRGAFPPRQMLNLSHDQENNDQCLSKAPNEAGLLLAP